MSQYIIIEGKSKTDLEIKVNKMIREGFKPVGSASVHKYTGVFPPYYEETWIQAMGKEQSK